MGEFLFLKSNMKFTNLKWFLFGLFVLLGFSSLGVFANDASVLNPCFSIERSDIEDWIRIVDYLCNETTLNIPDEIDLQPVVEIWENAFKNKWLTAVSFPSSLVGIGNFAFANNALTRVEIPEWVTRVWEGAFKKNQLSILVIPESLKVIQVDAFRWNKLKKVVVPWRLNTVDDGAFCDNDGSSVEGVSESLEWNFGKACFSLKRASLLEDSYAISESEEEWEEVFENREDDIDHSVILEEIDSEVDEQVDDEDDYENEDEDDEEFDELWKTSDEKNDFDVVTLNFSTDSSFWGMMNFWVWNIDAMGMINTFSVYACIIVYLITTLFALYPISIWEIYRKAWKKWWAFLVPIYWTMVYTEIGGAPKWLWFIPWLSVWLWYLVNYIPISVYSVFMMVLGAVTFLWWIVISYRIARRYHWNVISSVCFVLFFPITVLILGLWNSQYIMYREEEQKVENVDNPVIEPVVATEQLNTVVEHFVWSDEEASDSTINEVSKVDESIEENVSSQESVSVDLHETDSQEDTLQESGWEWQLSQDELSQSEVSSQVEAKDSNEDSGELQSMQTSQEESSLSSEPISDLDQLLANNKNS